MNRKKAFTLIELLIVLIIIGVLVSFALPQYSKVVEKAKAAEAFIMMGAIRSNETAHKLESGAYTTNINGLYIAGMNTDVASTTQYWSYTIPTAASAAYSILATRTPKSSGGETGKTIELDWDDTVGVTWTGTHSGVPQI